MKCKNCKKEMEEWEQLMCSFSCCKNKKCKFEGLVKISNIEDTYKQSDKLNEKFKNVLKSKKGWGRKKWK